MKQWIKRYRAALWRGFNGLLVLLALLCLWNISLLASRMDSQKAAERWQGENEQSFAQISCFVPVDQAVGLNQVYAFRTAMLEEFHKAALDAEGNDGLWVDAWSAVGKVTISSERSSGEASTIAVGGDFFNFHPLRLLSGVYLGENDLMKDRVLIDEELAWLLYGGTELTGMEVRVNGVPFLIAGVVEREQDDASLMAYTAGQGLYIPYESYRDLTGEEDITCYEAVMPEPVNGFAAQVAKNHFPLGRGEVLRNTGRFSYGRLLSLLRKMDERAMQAMGMIYPYWENAARVVENRCARLLLAAILLALLPAVTVAAALVKLAKRGKEQLEERVFPRLKDSAEEAIRVRQRRHWEKKHGKHEG